MGDYCQSCSEYMNLLKRPTIEKWMFDCSDYWQATFQAWNVIYFWAQIVLGVLYFLMNYELFEHLSSTIDGIVSMLVTLVVMLFWTHLAWFCVVRACCGKVGHIIWAILLVLSFVGRWGSLHLQGVRVSLSLKGLYFIIYSLLIVPVFYMALAACQLSCSNSGGSVKRGVALDKKKKSPAAEKELVAAEEGGGSPAPPTAGNVLVAPPQYFYARPAQSYSMPVAAPAYTPFMQTAGTTYAPPAAMTYTTAPPTYTTAPPTYAAPSSVVYANSPRGVVAAAPVATTTIPTAAVVAAPVAAAP